MEIWFEVSMSTGIIAKVQVEKYNAKSVWVKTGFNYVRRSPRVSAYSQYHPTFRDAYQAARRSILDQVSRQEKLFHRLRKYLSHLDKTDADSLPDPPKYDTPLLGLKDAILADIDIEITRKAKP